MTVPLTTVSSGVFPLPASITTAATAATAAVSAADAGYSIILAEAGGRRSEKAPLPRTGSPAGGIYAATNDRIDARRWVASAGVRINAGVLCGQPLDAGYQLAVLDLDTPTARSQFAELCAAHGSACPEMTTLSPGGLGADGAWEHWDGGHVWLRVPTASLPATLPATVPLTDGGAADAAELKVKGSWVMMPPSTRLEGSYRWGSAAIYDAPAWLVGLAASKAPAVKPKPVRGYEGNPERDEWETETLWSDILPLAGWEEDPRVSRCGCQLWNRPGFTSPGSAVAHEGCEHGHFLRLYTDSRGGDAVLDAAEEFERRNLTKIEVVSQIRYPEESDAQQRIRKVLVDEGLASASNAGDLSFERAISAAVQRLAAKPTTEPVSRYEPSADSPFTHF